MPTRAARKPAPAAPSTDDPEVVWEGADALRPFLVEIQALEPFPGNPRRGNVVELAKSLARFGQVRAALTRAPEGTMLVAGHHIVEAAIENGWTHVAAIPAEFESDEQARAYLLADNGLHDRGAYDVPALLEQLRQVQADAAQGLGGFEGTGYGEGHIAQFARELERARLASTPPAEFPPLDPGAIHVDYICPACRHGWSGNPRPGES